MSLDLTSGTVSIEDGVKAAEDYAPARKVRVDVTFQVPEGSDGQAELDAAGAAASRKIAELLGRAAPAALATGTTDQAAPATRTRRTRAQIEADEAAARKAEEVLKAADPAAMVAETPAAPASDPAAFDMGSAPVVAGEIVDPDPFGLEIPAETPAATPVTDADLNSAVQKRNGELANAAGTGKIRELIVSYRTDPTKAFNLKDIPADKRQEFIDKLAAITV